MKITGLDQVGTEETPQTLIPPGEYLIGVTAAEEKTSKNGYPQVALDLEILEGELKGRGVKDWLTVTEKALWKQWRYDLFAGAEVHGSTLGIMGMGRIGQAIARRGAHGFGMQVIYNNRSRLNPEVEAACGARYVGKDELLAQADHLVLVVPYSKEAHHTIGAAEIARMKPTATLTNIARGGIVDDAALIVALREGRIAAAGLDVFEGEPALNPGFLGLKNVVLTPHIASSTVATRLAMAHLAADNLIAYLTEGQARTPLNPEVIGASR
jgi:gluconate 2-dehydrogenase